MKMETKGTSELSFQIRLDFPPLPPTLSALQLAANIKLDELSQAIRVHLVFYHMSKSCFWTAIPGRGYGQEIQRDALCFPQLKVSKTQPYIHRRREQAGLEISLRSDRLKQSLAHVCRYPHSIFNSTEQPTRCTGFLQGQTGEHCF